MPKYTIQVPDGRKVTAEAPDEATALAGVQDWHSKNPIDESIGGAIKYGASGMLRGLESTLGRVSEETGGDKTATKAVGDLAASFENPNYRPADAIKADGPAGPISQFLHDNTNGWLGRDKSYSVDFSKLPRSIAEALAPTGVGLATVGASGALTNLGPLADQAEAAKGAPLDTLDKLGVGAKTAGISALQALPAGRLRAPMNQVGMRGVQEAVQRPLAVGAGTGAQGAATAALSGGDPVEGFVQGAATGGAIAGSRTPGNGAKAVKYRKFTDTEANAALANRLQEKGIGGAKRDFAAMRAVETDLKKDLAAEHANAKQSPGFNQNHEKILARAKLLEELSDADIASIRALGDDNLTSVVSQARAYHLLAQKGKMSGGKYKGGISGGIDRVGHGGLLWGATKLAGLTGVAGGAASIAGVGSGLNAAGTGGLAASLALKGAPILGGIYGASRLLDSETGSRLPATSFTRKFADGTTRHSRPQTPLQFNQGAKKALAQLKQGLGPAGPKPKSPQQLAATAMQKFNKNNNNQILAKALGAKLGGGGASTPVQPNLQGLQAAATAAKAKYNGMNDKQIADEATKQIMATGKLRVPPPRYWQGVHDRRSRAQSLWDATIAQMDPADLAKIGPDAAWLVKNPSRRADVKDAVANIRAHVSPRSQAVLDGMWTKTAINNIWKK
jgi:hypothetical protein